jgi:RNA polymerase sigma-B factor
MAFQSTATVLPTVVEAEARAGRERLIAEPVGLARSVARRFDRRGESLEDLEQVAMVGLVKAAARFDRGRNTQFTTFATATVTGELKRHFRDTRWGVHVSRSAQERYLLVQKATDWAQNDLGRAPTITEIAEWAGLDEERVLEALETAHAMHLESIDAAAAATDIPLVDQLGVDDNALGSVATSLSLAQLLRVMPEQQRYVLHCRFVLEMTQSQIADELGVTQIKVSRTLARTLAALRASLT